MGDDQHQGSAPQEPAAPRAASPRILDEGELSRQLRGLTGWTGNSQRLERTVAVAEDQLRPVLDAVERAERELNHHAKVETAADGIHFTVWTHSLDAVTDLDIALAARIDAAVAGVAPEA